MRRGNARLGPGKKTRAWNNTRASLKVKFKRAGIITCEAGFSGCWHDNALSFGHQKKRRNLVGNELSEVILICTPCHDQIEKLPETEMCAYVRGVIAARRVAV